MPSAQQLAILALFYFLFTLFVECGHVCDFDEEEPDGG